MGKIKIRTEIQRIDVYKIIFDDSIWTIDKIMEHSRDFIVRPDLKILANEIAFSIMRFGSDTAFIEGFGNIMMFRDGERIKHYSSFDGHPIMPKDYVPGIEVHIVEEDNEFDYESSIE